MTAIPSPAPVESEFDGIARRLESVGNQFRLAFLAGALGFFVMLVVPIATTVVFVAGAVNLPGWVSWLLVLTIPAALLVGYWCFLHARLWQRPTYAEIARWTEQHASDKKLDLENSLINAVLLADEMEQIGGPPSGPLADPRRYLIPQVLREVERGLPSWNLAAVIPWRRQLKPWLAAGAIVMVCAGAALLFPQRFARGLTVLAAPGRFVPQRGVARILTVAPGNETILAGEPVEFSVEVRTPQHRLVQTTLTLKFQNGVQHTKAMVVFGPKNRAYRYLLDGAAENMRYLITAGGTQSRWYAITVLPRIKLQSYQAVITPPPYTHLPRRTMALSGPELTATSGSFSAPLGSTVVLTAALNHALVGASAVLEANSATSPIEIRTQTLNQRTFTAHLTVAGDLAYDWLINDAGGRALEHLPGGPRTQSDERFKITAVADQPPTVHVLLPHRNISAQPGQSVPLKAQATDDYGLRAVELQVAQEQGGFKVVRRWQIQNAENGKPATLVKVQLLLPLSSAKYHPGQTLRYRFTATDNRDINLGQVHLGPQTTLGRVYDILLQPPRSAVSPNQSVWERLERRLRKMLAMQDGLLTQGDTLLAPRPLAAVHRVAARVAQGQRGLRQFMQTTATSFPFKASMATIRQALVVLIASDAAAAAGQAADLTLVSTAASEPLLAEKLHARQVEVRDALRAMLNIAGTHTSGLQAVTSRKGVAFPNQGRDLWRKLALALKKMEKQQRDVLNTSLRLAQKPIQQFDTREKNELAKMQALADQWSRFMNQALVNMSNLTEQDQANASLLDDVAQMNVDLAMVKKALEIKAIKIATPLEQEGLEDSKTLTSHIEEWLMQQPDTYKWEMEEPVTQNDVPAPPLPAQLTDMVGQLLEHEEDLTSDMESLGSKWNDSMNKGLGWGAMDGPISDMSAQGVTGNQMPKNDEIQGRSGAGREGRASGEMVGATDERKSGRRTPTRLTDNQYNSGQVKDTSGRAPGGATGGGKKSGWGGEGLEAPAPRSMDHQIKRMAAMQAQVLNQASRVQLQLRAAGFRNFKLLESAVLMQNANKALQAYRYHTALAYQQRAVRDLHTARVLSAAAAQVAWDNTPDNFKKRHKLADSMLGQLPKGYADPVKAYFLRLARPQ